MVEERDSQQAVEEYFIRFIVGGLIVSAFTVIGDLLEPKSFAGLFGAAPSVALATLILTIESKGKLFAAVEARSAMAGAVGFFAYACAVSWIMMHYDQPASRTAPLMIFVWLTVSLGLWSVCLR
jgi:hypothetical protein